MRILGTRSESHKLYHIVNENEDARIYIFSGLFSSHLWNYGKTSKHKILNYLEIFVAFCQKIRSLSIHSI